MPTPTKPTAALAKEYLELVMGDSFPTAEEITGILDSWKHYPAHFKKSLQSIQSMKNTKMLGEPSPALDAELKAGEKPNQRLSSLPLH